jgi:tripartite-type tricarboxylate transporter receptor subunit TctC
MMMHLKSIGLALTAILSIVALPTMAQDNYPSKQIKLMVGYAPGAVTDLTARLLAERLSAQMNATVIVENKPGASGHVATEEVAHAAPDGYTLMFNTADLVTGPALGQQINYDFREDLKPVSLVAFAPLTLFVHSSVPSNTVPEFVDWLKANPGTIYASSGVGAPNHLGQLLFLSQSGIKDAVHTPYKGGGPAMLDVVAGRVMFCMQTMTAVKPMADDKRIKVLAIASEKRSPIMPDVPTFDEAGLKGFQIGNWLGVMAPAGTPDEIVDKLNAEIAKAMKTPEMVARMEQEGAVAIGSSREEYSTYIDKELERWTKVVKESGVVAQ